MALTYSRITLPPLWSVADAKVHLHLTATDSDADILQKLQAAQNAIEAKLGAAADPAWTATSVPPLIRHAVVILADAFMENRGGAEGGPKHLIAAYETVDAMLAPFRDVSVA
jgi:Phage gp6-like head-tail connector protein